MASIGRVQIKGSILPRSGSIGRINVYYDGDFPQRVGSRGNVNIYRTSGNLQVIYRHPEDAAKHEFEGRKVDIYYDY